MNDPSSIDLQQRLRLYAQLLRLHKPIGIYLLLWPTLWSLWIAAAGFPDIDVSLVFVLGVILMRSAGCAINDYADRDIDRHITRTRERPLTRGAVTPKEAVWLFVGLSLVAFALVLQLNLLTIELSVVAALLAASYPFMKRYTHLPQIVLGMAFAWSVPMAYAAQTGGIESNAWLLYCATVVWVVAYDTMYAMVDRQDDLQIGVKSTAILFGPYDRQIIAGLQLTFIVLLVSIGVRCTFSFTFYTGVTVAAVLCLYQQWLLKDRQPAHCFKAFLNNHYVGMAVFAGIFGHYQFS